MWRIAFKAGQTDGWAKLANEFAGHGSFDFSRNYMTVNLGWMAYKSCVRVGISSEGLTLQIQFPFQYGHPDLFIPWDRLELTGRGLLGLSVQLDLKTRRPTHQDISRHLWRHFHGKRNRPDVDGFARRLVMKQVAIAIVFNLLVGCI